MKIRILSDVCLGNGVDGAVGEVHDVPQSLAIDLVKSMGVAEYVVDEPVRTTVAITTQDPVPQNRDPKLPGRKQL